MDHSGQLHGIVHHSNDGTLSHLPLFKVSINVLMVDVSARVTLKQTFINPSETETSRAKYVFPVPPRAAVCAFEMLFGDRRVFGVSKDKDLAQTEFESATREGKAAALVDWVTNDLFTISIGSVPAKQRVIAKLVFVMDLMDDELIDQVRLQLPMSVGCRYGREPAALAGAVQTSSITRLRITVDIQMSERIESVSSSSHPGIQIKPYYVADRRRSRRRKTAELSSPTFLQDNFVLVVRASGLDAPRCFAERDPGGSGTVALQLTWVPKLKFPVIQAQQFLFLVDRSGSMTGVPIEITKNALKLLLHMLPNAQTSFNIVSFGTRRSSLWPRSQPYNKQTLNEATYHIGGIEADHGGTELANGLEFTFSLRSSNVPTVVIVLTDGMVYDGEGVVSTVSRAMAQSNAASPLRVYALGIGTQVSMDIVDRIALAGNGESLFASQDESIVGKLSKLMRAGRASAVENVSIDWGFQDPPQDPTQGPFSVDFSTPGHVRLWPPRSVQQSPNQILTLSPSVRFVAFALTTYRDVPRQVTLRGQFDGQGGQFTEVVNVSTVTAFGRRDVPLVHTLAARRLINDFEERRAPLPTASDLSLTQDAIRKAVIVQLGVQYQLASRYTSFIAVDDWSYMSRKQLRVNSQSFADEALTLVSDTVTSLLDASQSILSSIAGIFGGGSTRGRPIGRIPGTYPSAPRTPSPSFVNAPDHDGGNDDEDDDDERDKDNSSSTSTMSSLEWDSSDSDSSRSPTRGRARSPSPAFGIPPYIPRPLDSAPGPSVQPEAVPTQVFSLINLQNFDGSFDLTPLGGIVEGPALLKPAGVQVDDQAWATAVAVAFLRKHLAGRGQLDVLQALLDKVMEFVDNTPMEVPFVQLVERAKGLIQ